MVIADMGVWLDPRRCEDHDVHVMLLESFRSIAACLLYVDGWEWESERGNKLPPWEVGWVVRRIWVG